MYEKPTNNIRGGKNMKLSYQNAVLELLAVLWCQVFYFIVVLTK